MITGLQLDWETADRITVANLRQYQQLLQQQLDNHLHMSAEDAVTNSRVIAAIDVILQEFMGTD